MPTAGDVLWVVVFQYKEAFSLKPSRLSVPVAFRGQVKMSKFSLLTWCRQVCRQREP